jgi:helicase
MADADAFVHSNHFRTTQATIDHAYINQRFVDYYISLVGDLFSRLANPDHDAVGWARLGNALWQISSDAMRPQTQANGISSYDTSLCAAAAYYSGGYPASAYLMARSVDIRELQGELPRACFDLLARPPKPSSQIVARALDALRNGDRLVLEGCGPWIAEQLAACRV